MHCVGVSDENMVGPPGFEPGISSELDRSQDKPAIVPKASSQISFEAWTRLADDPCFGPILCKGSYAFWRLGRLGLALDTKSFPSMKYLHL